MTLITNTFMDLVYVIDITGTMAVAAWVIVVLAMPNAERNSE
ncbi:MAG: hypothetical protein ACRDRL_13580 [Sciscionella sp.]